MFSIGYFYVPGSGAPSGGTGGGGGGGTGPVVEYATKSYVDTKMLEVYGYVDQLIVALGGTTPSTGSGDDPNAPPSSVALPDYALRSSVENILSRLNVLENGSLPMGPPRLQNIEYQLASRDVTMGDVSRRLEFIENGRAFIDGPPRIRDIEQGLATLSSGPVAGD